MIAVLYVDDEPDLLAITKLFLEKKGEFAVYTAPSVENGFQILDENLIDVIVSDYQMPGMSGIDFLKKFRSLPDDRPFILFTGRGREEVVIEAINNGADFYLQKGGDVRSQFAELAQKIRQGALRYRAELELKKKHEELQAAYEELAASEEEMRINFEELTKSRLALAESEKKLSDIINFLPDATFAIDAEGKILVWNKAIEEMTGYSSEVMVGKGDYEYALPFYGERIPILIDYILSGLPHIEKRYSNIQRDGNKISAETAYPKHHGQPMIAWAIASPLYNESGQIIGAIESIRDITTQKENEERVRKSEELYRSVIENIQDGYYRSDAEGKLILASPSFARLFGYDSLEEILNRPIAETFYFRPEERKFFLEKIQKEGFLDNEEIRVRKKDGTPFVVSVSSHFYYDDDGNIAGVEGIFKDISSLKKIETYFREKIPVYDGIIQNAPIGIQHYTLHDDDRILLDASNRSADHLLSLDSNALVGKRIEEVFADRDKREIPTLCREMIRTGETNVHHQITCRDLEGTMHTCNLTICQTGQQSITIFII